jgi:hypothetical protein
MGRIMGLVLGLLLIFGCGGKTYWMVDDLNTNKAYYTQGIDSLSSGAVKFTDARTGNTITLQSHGEKKITEEEFKAAVANAEKSQEPKAVPPAKTE